MRAMSLLSLYVARNGRKVSLPAVNQTLPTLVAEAPIGRLAPKARAINISCTPLDARPGPSRKAGITAVTRIGYDVVFAGEAHERVRRRIRNVWICFIGGGGVSHPDDKEANCRE